MIGRRGHTKNASADAKTLFPNGGTFFSQHAMTAKNVEDCLLELDVYLEEIDREYALACAYSSGGGGAAGCSTATANTSAASADYRPVSDSNNNRSISINDGQNAITTNVSMSICRSDHDDDDGADISPPSINLCSLETIDLGIVATDVVHFEDDQKNAGSNGEIAAAGDIDSIAYATTSDASIACTARTIATTTANDNDNVFRKISKRMSCSDWDLDGTMATPAFEDGNANCNDLLKRGCRTRCTIAAFEDISMFTARERDRTNGMENIQHYFILLYLFFFL